VPCTKVPLNWTHDRNIKTKTTELLEDSVRVTPHYPGLEMESWIWKPYQHHEPQKVDGFDSIKRSNFHASEDIIKKRENSRTRLQILYHEGLIPRIYEELLQCKDKQPSLEYMQKTWIDIPPKVCEWPGNAWEDVQRHSFLEKYNWN
jgi:hypothetical protein